MTTFDPLSAPGDSPGLEELRAECPVARTPAGPWYLARHADVLAATQDVHLFEASFREPGIVVPDEEQLINEIPEPRHGQVRKIINSAIAVHRLVNIEPFCEQLCHNLLDDLLARPGPVELVHDFVMPVPNNVIAHLLGAPPADFTLLGRVVRRGGAGHLAGDEPQRTRRRPARGAPRVRRLRRRLDRRSA